MESSISDGKKPRKRRRAIPKKETESIRKDAENKLILEELEEQEVRELGGNRPAFAFGDPLLPHPFNTLDALLIDPFLLQEDWIRI